MVTPERRIIMKNLPKTGSGRHVIPPLKYWTGERVIIDPDDQSVDIVLGSPDTQVLNEEYCGRSCMKKAAKRHKTRNIKGTNNLRRRHASVVPFPDPPISVASLPKTRSGRHVIPPLSWWTGQRVTVDPDDQSVRVAQGTPNTQSATVPSDKNIAKRSRGHIPLARKILAGKTQRWVRDSPSATYA
ncbi:hypothetical protein LSAT2_020070 [Lamellibrachia satsuma]|nr:hypothetical protein LSAT2_020070 [Lamellibrachia satsuma]